MSERFIRRCIFNYMISFTTSYKSLFFLTLFLIFRTIISSYLLAILVPKLLFPTYLKGEKSTETRVKKGRLIYYPFFLPFPTLPLFSTRTSFSPSSPHPRPLTLSSPLPLSIPLLTPPSPLPHTSSPFKQQPHFFTPADRKKESGSDVGLDRDSVALSVTGWRGQEGRERRVRGIVK